MRELKLVLGVLLLGLVVVFAIQNAEELQVNFLFWTLTMRRALVLFSVLVVGIILGWALHSVSESRREDAP